MSCQKTREWLENASSAGLAEMPAELSQHMQECPACAALLSRLSAQCISRLPQKLVVRIPDIKKQVLSKITIPDRKVAEKEEKLPWQAWWKLVMIPLVLVLLLVFYSFSSRKDRISNQGQDGAEAFATITQINNQVEKRGKNEKSFALALIDDRLTDGDEIQTGKEGLVKLLFADGSKVSLGAKASFEVKTVNCLGKHRSGRAVFEIKKQPPQTFLKVITPQGVTTVIGTLFVQDINEKECFVAVSEGCVEFMANKDNSKHLLKPGDLLRFAPTGENFSSEKLQAVSLRKLLDLTSTGKDRETKGAVEVENKDVVPVLAPMAKPTEIASVGKAISEKYLNSVPEEMAASEPLYPDKSKNDVEQENGTENSQESSNLEVPDSQSDAENEPAYGSGQSTFGVSGF